MKIYVTFNKIIMKKVVYKTRIPNFQYLQDLGEIKFVVKIQLY